jgi:hypothetical protein
LYRKLNELTWQGSGDEIHLHLRDVSLLFFLFTTVCWVLKNSKVPEPCLFTTATLEGLINSSHEKLEIKKWGGLKWTRKILSFVVKKYYIKKNTSQQVSTTCRLRFLKRERTVHETGIKKFFYFVSFFCRKSHIASHVLTLC